MVVMLTGYGEVEMAVKAMRLGAENFLTKPVDMNHLMAVIEKAAEKKTLRRETVALKLRLRPSRRRQMIKVALFGLLVLVAALVGKMIGGTGERVNPRAVIPVPFDANDTAGAPRDSSSVPNRN